MRMSVERASLVAAAGLLVAGSVLSPTAPVFRISRRWPARPARPVDDEAAPITFGNPVFQQRSIADRQTQLAASKPNSGSWDMITVNETGPHKGRYLFTVFETGQSGVQRTTCVTGQTDTIWHSPCAGGHVVFRCRPTGRRGER